MRSYYSIISISTKPFLGEKIGIGLLCVSPSEIFFHYSEEKFKLISKLLPKEARILALNSLKSIHSVLQTENKNNSQLFQESKPESVSETYLNYLNRYNNNLVQFSSVEEIEMELNKFNFRKMFQKYIYNTEIFEVEQKSNCLTEFDSFKKTFKPRLKQYVNIDFKVSNDIIKGLISPVTVDLFGKNGAFVTGQSIDFSKDKNWLLHDINAYMYLTLSTEMSDKNAKCFLIGEEPNKKLGLNHEIWNNARNAKNIEFVSIDESEKVIEYLIKKGVTPILS
jgi:hypothetical protein